VRIEGSFIQMILHWQGGDHTALNLKINGVGKHRWTVPEDTLSLIRELARPPRLHRRAPQLGLGDDPEPSLMMPGIIISLIFSEQGKLVLRAAPLQNQFASAVEAVNNPANGFGIQISAANFPGCTRSYLFAL
jgi:hypothetical protein